MAPILIPIQESTLKFSMKPMIPLVFRQVRRGGLAILLFASLGSAPLWAQEQSYLPAGRPDPIALLAPPPVPGSPEQSADLASTLAISKARTPQDESLARSERKFTVFNFAPAIGPVFQAGTLPETQAFFKRIQREVDVVTDTGKDHWKRPRPYIVDPSLAAGGGEMEKSYSYPSGHSTRATVDALLLSDLFPDKKEAIQAIGRNIGWHRVEIGRHYPTDIYAGRTLAQAIVREFKASAAFQADFEKVKEEIARAQRVENEPAGAPAHAVSTP